VLNGWQVSREAIEKRYSQGWLLEVIDNLDTLVARIRVARTQSHPVSIGYHGNVVDVWYVAGCEVWSGVGVNQSSCSALLYFNPLTFFTYSTLLTTHDNAFGVLGLRRTTTCRL